jgi:glycosyltransferase involved in cell wall biosynthesis
MPLPKVLILNQPFVTDTGGGITLSNLFSGWDKDKLAVACLGYVLTPHIDSAICNNYYQLGDDERNWVFPLNVLSRKYTSGPIKFTDTSKKNVVEEATKSKTRVGFLNKYLNPFLEYTSLSQIITKTTLSPKFKEWLDDYAPDVIYVQCSTRESILFCTEVIKYLKKPSVFHMMDDWPMLIGVKGFFSSYWKNKIDNEFKTLLNLVDTHLSICDYMAEAYKKRYGIDFITFHNPIDLDFWQKGQKKEYKLSNASKLMSAGRIGLGIDTSLKTIAKAIDKINMEMQMNIQFVIQSIAPPAWIKNYPAAIHKSFVPYSKLPLEFGSPDFLILPYDFSPESLAYIKYSMPTKASEYMASGTPIIIYAPADTALVDYAQQSKWATIVTEEEEYKLIEGLKKMISDENNRKKLAETAKEVAKKRHDIRVVTKDFQKTLSETAQKTKKV